MSPFRFRQATPADVAVIRETLVLAFGSEYAVDEGLEERLASPEVWALLAFDGDDPAGHVAIAEHSPSPVAAAPEGHAKLWQVFVRPRWHGSGVATDLMREAEREAIDRGYVRMALWTPRDSTRARRFYQREGWVESGRVMDETPLGLAVVEYVRQLIPEPEDDGAAAGLVGSRLPAVSLEATSGEPVSLASLPGRCAVFAYPRTGRPGEESLGGNEFWNSIPGARGCTPEACAIRDDHARFEALGVRVFGLSTQSPEDQREAAERLHLPYPLLSDPDAALGLPTFEVEGVTLYRRITLIVRDGLIDDLVYPVFPPGEAPAQALARLA